MLSMDPLYSMPDGIETKWASPENEKAEKGKGGQAKNGRKGRAWLPVAAGECFVLAEEKSGSGTIRKIWATINVRTPEMLRGLLLEFNWDGAAAPAVSVPFGDFFGVGLGRMATFQSALFTSPEGRSFNSYVPMPFRDGMKVTLTNNSGQDLTMLYYDVDYTMGDKHGSDTLYFHAQFNRENPTTQRRDFEILRKVEGKGRFLGCNVGVIADKQRYYTSWWGEGEVKIYLDGDTGFPTLCGTGTEDYIGTAWAQGRYDHLYQGCTIADMENMQYCFYRYHVLDPIYFHKDIRVTIQQLGCWSPEVKPLFAYSGVKCISNEGKVMDFSKDDGSADYGLFERCDDWSSCAYYYLNRAEGV